jgi:hypothetical protein
MFKFLKKKWVQVFLYFCFLVYIFPDVNNFFLFLFFLGAALIYFPSFRKSLFGKFNNSIKNVFKAKQSSAAEKTPFEANRETQDEIKIKRENSETKMHGTLYALDEGNFGSTEYGKSAWRDFEKKLVDTLEKTFKKIIDGKYLDVYKWDTNNKTVFISGSDKFIFNIKPIANNENTSIWGQLPWQTRQDGIYIEVQRPKDASKNPSKALRSMFEAAVDQIKSRTNVYINRQCTLTPLTLPGGINGYSGFIPCKENIIENETSFFCSISLISNDIYKKNEELESIPYGKRTYGQKHMGAYSYIDPPADKELDEIGFDFDVTNELSYLAHLSGEPNLGNPSLFGYIPIIYLGEKVRMNTDQGKLNEKNMTTKKYKVKIIEFNKVKVVPDNGDYAGDEDYHMSEFITEWKLEIDGNPHKVKYFFEEYWIGYSPREAGRKIVDLDNEVVLEDTLRGDYWMGMTDERPNYYHASEDDKHDDSQKKDLYLLNNLLSKSYQGLLDCDLNWDTESIEDLDNTEFEIEIDLED